VPPLHPSGDIAPGRDNTGVIGNWDIMPRSLFYMAPDAVFVSKYIGFAA
jgi:hypothetical protein